MDLRVGERRGGEIENARAIRIVIFGVPVEVVDVDQWLAVGGRRGLERGEIFVREPIRAVRSCVEFALPAVNSFKAVVNGTEDDRVRELILDRFGEVDRFGDVVVGCNRIVALDFEMRGVPELGLVVEIDEGRVRCAGAEDSGGVFD